MKEGVKHGVRFLVMLASALYLGGMAFIMREMALNGGLVIYPDGLTLVEFYLLIGLTGFLFIECGYQGYRLLKWRQKVG